MPVYTLFGQSGGGTVTADTANYTMGMQFTVSQSCTLTGIWWFSPAGAGDLPSGTAIFLMTGAGTGSVVAGTNNASPSWSGAAGSGWVKVTYPGTTTLTPGNTYKVAILHVNNGLNFYGATAHYWDSGSGSAGLTNGPLSAPNNAGADGGQDTFVSPSASISYPTTSFNATNYWVDVEVTTTAAAATTPILAAPDDRSRRLLMKRRILGL